MIVNGLFLTVCFIIDFIVLAIAPQDPSLQSFVYMSQASLIGLLCLTKDRTWFDGVVLAFIVGIVVDFISFEFMVFTPVYIISVLIARQWGRHFSDTFFENVLLFLSIIFAKELILYFMMLVLESITLSTESFLLNRGITTLVINIPTICIVLMLYKVKENFTSKREERKKKEEVTLYRNY